jgi:hypothetical protein
VIIGIDFPNGYSKTHRRLHRTSSRRAAGVANITKGKIKTALLQRNASCGGALPHVLSI